MSGARGIALVSVLLVLLTLMLLGLSLQLFALFHAQLARNSVEQLRARVSTANSLTSSLLQLEQLAVVSGSLPADASGLSEAVHYELLGTDLVLLRASSSTRPGINSEALAGFSDGQFHVWSRR